MFNLQSSMKVLQIRLLAIDVDGTLLNSDDTVTPAVDEALRRATDAGIRILLATGRRYSRTLPVAEPLGIDAPLVTAGGGLIKRPTDHQTLFSASFDPQVLRAAVAVVNNRGYDALLYGDTFAEGFDFYLARYEVSTPQLREYLDLNPTDGRLFEDLGLRLPDGIFLFFTMGTREQMLDLERELHRQLPGELSINVLRSPRYTGFMCEIAPAGISKWSGVLYLAQQWGVEPAEICAVGDDVNDVLMIRGAGLGVAMGNASEIVQAAADRVAPRHDEDGLAEVVRWILN